MGAGEKRKHIDWFMSLQKNAIGKRVYPYNDRYHLTNRGHVYDRIKKVWLRPIIRRGGFYMNIKDIDGCANYTSILTLVAETFFAEGRRVIRTVPIDGNRLNTHLSNIHATFREKDEDDYFIEYPKQLFDKAVAYEKPNLTERDIEFNIERQQGKCNPKFFEWLANGKTLNFK